VTSLRHLSEATIQGNACFEISKAANQGGLTGFGMSLPESLV
jgi:hypothetical protein